MKYDIKNALGEQVAVIEFGSIFAAAVTNKGYTNLADIVVSEKLMNYNIIDNAKIISGYVMDQGEEIYTEKSDSCCIVAFKGYQALTLTIKFTGKNMDMWALFDLECTIGYAMIDLVRYYNINILHASPKDTCKLNKYLERTKWEIDRNAKAYSELPPSAGYDTSLYDALMANEKEPVVKRGFMNEPEK